MDTIIQDERVCFHPACDKTEGLELHHCLEGSYRGNKKNPYGAELYGLKVYMCHKHHMHLHDNAEDMMKMRAFAQGYAMAYYGWTLEEFREKVGRNFI